MSTGERWDALVVGGGTAGCAVAAQLADSGRRVLLVEAGPGEPRPASVAGLDVIAAAGEPGRQWSGMLARSGPGSVPHPYRQGRGLGGGSMINALLLSPGDRLDYRRWEERLACTGWGPGDMDPWLSRAANRFPRRTLPPGPVTRALEAAAADHGHPVGGSSMDQERLGVVEAALAIEGDRRRSVVDAYLAGRSDSRTAGGRSGDAPAIRTGTAARRILVADGRASGVELSDGSRVLSPLVVVCCGAIGTPVLLARSDLTARPVGRTLKDHPSFAFTLTLRRDVGAAFGGPDAADRGSRSGAPGSGTPSSDGSGFPSPLRNISRLLRWSSGPDEHGDLQAFVIDRVDDGARADGAGPDAGARAERPPVTAPMAVVVVGLMRVSGRGSVGPPSHDHGRPEVVLGGRGSSDDRRRLGAGVRQIHDLLRTDRFRPLVDEIHIDDIGTPAEALQTMDEAGLADWLIGHPGPYTHPAASCPMGPESEARSVVDCRPERAGRLLGYDGIYLADASIMPDLVQGGLQIPVMALAERVVAGITARG